MTSPNLNPNRQSVALFLALVVITIGVFGGALFGIAGRQEQISNDLGDVQDLLSNPVTVEGGRYETALLSDRETMTVPISGRICFDQASSLVATDVRIRWSWAANVPDGMRPFYDEAGGTTTFGQGRLALDGDNCFEFSEFPQRFPPALADDLDANPNATGPMSLTFTLQVFDLTTSTSNPIVAPAPLFVFAGPFQILPTPNP